MLVYHITTLERTRCNIVFTFYVYIFSFVSFQLHHIFRKVKRVKKIPSQLMEFLT